MGYRPANGRRGRVRYDNQQADIRANMCSFTEAAPGRSPHMMPATLHVGLSEAAVEKLTA